MSFTFYLEEVPWPFVHVLVPAAVYIAIRNPELALLVMYGSETVEAVVRPFFSRFDEQCDDELIGDIVLGSLAILTFWLLDVATGAAQAFREAVPLSLRFAALILPPAYSAIFLSDPPDSLLDLRTLLFYAFYALTALILHTRVIFWPRRGTKDPVAGKSLLVWLAYALVLAIVAAPITDGSRVWLTKWMRMFYAASFFFLAAAYAVFYRLLLNDDNARVPL